MTVALRPGDLFVCRSTGFIAWAIRVVQWFWSTDNEATYNHAGVITSERGDTVEALGKIGCYNLSGRRGQQMMIVRHRDMTLERFQAGMDAVKEYYGDIYPFWRLPLFVFKLAKFVRGGPGVCSEMTGMFMAGAGFKNIVYGLTPDDLADRWRIDRDMDIVFEGVWANDIQ